MVNVNGVWKVEIDNVGSLDVDTASQQVGANQVSVHYKKVSGLANETIKFP